MALDEAHSRKLIGGSALPDCRRTPIIADPSPHPLPSSQRGAV
jgi:hypothetical protein